jgi:hypothetical protein
MTLGELEARLRAVGARLSVAFTVDHPLPVKATIATEETSHLVYGADMEEAVERALSRLEDIPY